MIKILRHALEQRIFVAFLVLCTAFILWLPVFPSADGSAHIYYSHVSGQLMGHAGSYADYYQMRRLVGKEGA